VSAFRKALSYNKHVTEETSAWIRRRERVKKSIGRHFGEKKSKKPFFLSFLTPKELSFMSVIVEVERQRLSIRS